MKKLTLAATTAVLAMGATALYAAPGGTMRRDTNGDGAISRAEAQAQVTAMFARMDANNDGKLDAADRAAHQAQMFDKIDTDKNGAISRAEFDAHHAGMGAHKGGGEHAGMDHGQGGPGGHRMAMRMHGGGGMGMLRMADANNDGAVTRAEAEAAALKHFDTVDANKDGQISRDERRAAMQAMRGKMGHGAGGDEPVGHEDHDN